MGGAARRGGQIDHQRSSSKLIAFKHDGEEIPSVRPVVLARTEPVAERSVRMEKRLNDGVSDCYLIYGS